MTTPADARALEPHVLLLRRLRDLKGLKEARAGVFQCRGADFLRFTCDEQGVVRAELKKAAGGGFDRYAIDTPQAQRRLLDDARRRAGRAADDD